MPSKEYTLKEETELKNTLGSEIPMNCYTTQIAAGVTLRSTERRLTKNPKHAYMYCS